MISKYSEGPQNKINEIDYIERELQHVETYCDCFIPIVESQLDVANALGKECQYEISSKSKANESIDYMQYPI